MDDETIDKILRLHSKTKKELDAAYEKLIEDMRNIYKHKDIIPENTSTKR